MGKKKKKFNCLIIGPVFCQRHFKGRFTTIWLFFRAATANRRRLLLLGYRPEERSVGSVPKAQNTAGTSNRSEESTGVKGPKSATPMWAHPLVPLLMGERTSSQQHELALDAPLGQRQRKRSFENLPRNFFTLQIIETYLATTPSSKTTALCIIIVIRLVLVS